MQQFEKLGSFYLGRGYDLEAGHVQDDLVLYDAKDLTTHAVCVGMTGSGKTGLCVSLLEEAAIDGVPALAIDPKGDLGNLLLTFPELRPEDFRPWINEDDARRKGFEPNAWAAQQAELWRKGLADWGQTGERIRRLRAAAEFAIYTPGSSAGRPLSILSSFAAPPAAVTADADLFQDRVSTTATSLLGLLGIKADPIRSREHILLSTIFAQAWHRGEDLELGRLIREIQDPPVDRVGVFELESFYPSKERFELAMQLNNLLAAPGFKSWMTGEPLDVGKLLYTAEGRPRIAILSIAHLSEAERMFFVSLVLNQTLGWVRTRPGTSSLRALLYMDEVFGYMPPTAEPPSKRPLLTLLKQARAHGVGVVLATQNPVDLDYKGLSNTGTWLLGRLQTERDKMRVLEGLEGASAGGNFDRAAMERTLAGLGKRVFLMHNVHENRPVVFHTRWAMSYLRGPMTREHIRQLTPKSAAPVPAPAATHRAAVGPAQPRPVLPRSVPQAFVPSRQATGNVLLAPTLIGFARVQYVDRKTKRVMRTDPLALQIGLDDASPEPDWERAATIDLVPEDLETEPASGAAFAALPGDAGDAKSYSKWKRALADHLYRTKTLDLFSSPSLGLTSEPDEDERDFRIRLGDLARERRDREADKIKKRFGTRLARLEGKKRRAAEKVERESDQARGQKMSTAISLGATVLSAVLGRKSLSLGTLGRATSTARGATRVTKEAKDVARARDALAAIESQELELNSELEEELEMLDERFDADKEELETVSIRPRRTDVNVKLVTLAWSPTA